LSENPFYYKGRIKWTKTSEVDERFFFAGYGFSFGGPSGQKKPADDWEKTCEILPEVTQYGFPERGPAEERWRVQQLYKDQRPCETPKAMHFLGLAQIVLAADCFAAPCPAWFKDGLPTPLDLVEVISDMSPKKSPGYPAVLIGREKLEVITENFDWFYQAVCVRILALEYVSGYCVSTRDYYDNFCCDPVVASIKNEIKKETKGARIFLATPVVTEAVERLLYTEFSRVAKANWGINHSCIGIGFTVADSRRFLDPFSQGDMDDSIMTSDVPTFDLSVTEEEEVLDAELVMTKYGLPQGHRIRYIMDQNSRIMMRRLIIFSDGVVWVQLCPGGQATGRYVTSLFNTETRARRSIAVDLYIELIFKELVQDPFIRDAGDDAVERYHPLKERAYIDLGFPLRDIERVHIDDVEFCSHRWARGVRPIGQRIVKSVANLLFKSHDEDAWQSFLKEYSNHPNFSEYVSRILVIRPGINNTMNIVNVNKCKKKKKGGKKGYTVGQQRVANYIKALDMAREAKSKWKGRANTSMVPHVAHSICSVTDAFCPHARGAKYPDANAQRTFPYTARSIVQLQADANGSACMLVCPGWTYGYSVFSSITTEVATMANLIAFGGTATFTPSHYRVVSLGVKVVSQTTATSSQGIIALGELSGQDSATFVTIDMTDPTKFMTYQIYPVANHDPIFWLSRRGGMSSNMFEAPNVATITTVDTNEFSCLAIMLRGVLANTNIIRVEIVANYELQFASGTSGSQLTSPPPPPNPAAQNGASLMLANAAGTFKAKSEEAFSGFVSRMAKQAAQAAISGVGMAIGGMLGGEPGAMVGYEGGRAAARMVD
jgi:hypothetical protein